MKANKIRVKGNYFPLRSKQTFLEVAIKAQFIFK
jgi:hypothetical protein